MDEFKDINSLSASLETPDLISLQKKAIESATGFSMPGSLHYETNTDGDTLFKSNIGAFGQLGLNSSYNFNTKETNTSVKVPFPLCPLFTKEYDLSMNTDAGVTTSFGVGPFSVSTKDKYSDPSISVDMVSRLTGNPVAGLLNYSIIKGGKTPEEFFGTIKEDLDKDIKSIHEYISSLFN